MESDSDTSTLLGQWADGDFAATVSRHRGAGVDADLPDDTRFVAGVAQLVIQRAAEAARLREQDQPGIAIFVLCASPPAAAGNTKRVPMVDNGLTTVTGRLWFATPAVISARYLELPNSADDDAHFHYVAEDLGLGEEPTLIFDSRVASNRLRWYPEGLARDEAVEFPPLDGDVTTEEVFEAIDLLHERCFVTPSGLPQRVNLWQRASGHWPREDAEALVQSHLKAGLTLRFPYCKVRHEQTQTAGRTDLEIERFNPLDRSSVTYQAILELKVLRTFRHTGTSVSDAETKEAISEGVRQAVSYREHKAARWSALCCFDMRRSDGGDEACFAHVQGSADAGDVTLKRWFLYASPAEYRMATVP